MQTNQVQFSIAAYSAWAPGVVTDEAWLEWAQSPFSTDGVSEPAVKGMPAMLRRRAGFLGKMALEVAYRCMEYAGEGESEDQHNVPTVFCSRHGDAERSTGLLSELVRNEPVSPTSFGLAVHNATAGLFSIARGNHANHIALASGSSTVEHGVIEACSLLADGANKVLLVVYDTVLPAMYKPYLDCDEQPHAWALLIKPADRVRISLAWEGAGPSEMTNQLKIPGEIPEPEKSMPASLQVLRFLLRRDSRYERVCGNRRWIWCCHSSQHD